MGLQIIQALYVEPVRSRSGGPAGWVDLTDEKLVDPHRKNKKHGRKQVVIYGWHYRHQYLFVVGVRWLKMHHGGTESDRGLDQLDRPFQEHHNCREQGTEDRQQDEKSTIEKSSLEDLLD